MGTRRDLSSPYCELAIFFFFPKFILLYKRETPVVCAITTVYVVNFMSMAKRRGVKRRIFCIFAVLAYRGGLFSKYTVRVREEATFSSSPREGSRPRMRTRSLTYEIALAALVLYSKRRPACRKTARDADNGEASRFEIRPTGNARR